MLAIQEGTQIMEMEYEMFDELDQGAKELIEGCIENPNLRQEFKAIIDYQRTKLEEVIDKKLLKTMKGLGITCFGRTVKEAKVYILEFVDQHPELRDENPQRCLYKILYYFAYCYHNNQPI